VRTSRFLVVALSLLAAACYQSVDPNAEEEGGAGYTPSGPPVLYLNFEGGQFSGAERDDAVRNRSVVAADGPLAVSGFAYERGIGGEVQTPGQVIADITRQVRSAFSDFNVDIVRVRPEMGPYSMVVVGGTLDEVLEMGRCVGGGVDMAAGIAPIDCANAHDLNVAFVAPECLPASGAATFRRLTAVAVAHEAGHLFGLEHVEPGSGSLMEVGASELTWGRGAVVTPECGVAVQGDRATLRSNLGG